MDATFLRTLVELRAQALEHYCILTQRDKIIVCTQPAQMYSDLRDVPTKTFVTGWQHHDGISGSWTSWKNIDERPRSTFVGSHVSLSGDLSPAYSSHTQKEFLANINSMIDDMKRGQYFLSNLTRHVEYDSVDIETVAIASCIYHDTPFRFVHVSPQQSVLGLSPERFVSITDNKVTCEPMKGTHEDADVLLADEKEHEENTMMIDLVRSDLSRICAPESISVVSRDNITHHPGLAQMSSTVDGVLLPDNDLVNSIAALMPVASVTGTPKPYVIHAMNDYEKGSRGIYCGTYGWVDTTNNEADLAVAIRTLDNTPQRLRIGTGAGITVRSDPQWEWDETELKLSRLSSLNSRGLIQESAQVFTSFVVDQNKRAFGLEEHCERLARHGTAVGISTNAAYIKETIVTHIRDHSLSSSEKVRVELSQDGECTVVFYPYGEMNADLTLGIAFVPTSQTEGELPKFTNRNTYDQARDDANACSDEELTDALVLNGSFVLETTRSNIFIRNGYDIFTPPASSGIINGVLRQHLLTHGIDGFSIQERNITLDNVLSADEIVTTNSVRGALSVTRIDHNALEINRTYQDNKHFVHDANKVFNSLFTELSSGV